MRRGEGRPEAGVHGKSECGASRLARHRAPGHEGPRVQGRRAVTLCWRQRQPHGCWCGWRGSHEGAVPGEGRCIAVAEACPLLRSALGPRTAHTSRSLGPQPVRCSSPPAPLSSTAAAAASGKLPEQRPGCPRIWQRGHVVAEASPRGGGEPGSHPPLQTPVRPTACGGERSRACRPPSRPCGSP